MIVIVIVVTITCDLNWFLGFASDLWVPHLLGATNRLDSSTNSPRRLVSHSIYFSFAKFRSISISFSDPRGSTLSSGTSASRNLHAQAQRFRVLTGFVKFIKFQKKAYSPPPPLGHLLDPFNKRSSRWLKQPLNLTELFRRLKPDSKLLKIITGVMLIQKWLSLPI